MWPEKLLGILLRASICQTHTQEPQFVPYIRIFCFGLGAAYQFVKCGAKVGESPSAAAVTERETLPKKVSYEQGGNFTCSDYCLDTVV